MTFGRMISLAPAAEDPRHGGRASGDYSAVRDYWGGAPGGGVDPVPGARCPVNGGKKYAQSVAFANGDVEESHSPATISNLL
jgi:hypothetical protein